MYLYDKCILWQTYLYDKYFNDKLNSMTNVFMTTVFMTKITGPADIYRKNNDMNKIVMDYWALIFRYENTLPTYQRAVERGAEMIELDVQLSKVLYLRCFKRYLHKFFGCIHFFNIEPIVYKGSRKRSMHGREQVILNTFQQWFKFFLVNILGLYLISLYQF